MFFKVNEKQNARTRIVSKYTCFETPENQRFSRTFESKTPGPGFEPGNP